MNRPGDYTLAECRKLSNRELERTFWYPGPTDVRGLPGPLALQRWALAKETCRQCPLEYMCAQDFLGEDHGVWGGMDPHERSLERRRRTQARLRDATAAREAVGWTKEAVDAAA